jgi:hypothetical protein
MRGLSFLRLVAAATALAACSIPDTQFEPLTDDGPGSGSTALTIVASVTALEVTEAGEGAIMVTLSKAPGAPLTVAASTRSPKIALGQPELRFTAETFDQPQRLSVTGLADADTVVEHADITLSAADVDSVIIGATVQDDDTVQLITDIGTGGVVTINEAGSAMIRVRLSAQPSTDVRVEASIAAGPVTISGASSRIFTAQNYDLDQTFTFAAADDVNIVTEDLALTLRASGVADKVATLRAVDDDVLNLAVNPSSLQVTEQGTPGLEDRWHPGGQHRRRAGREHQLDRRGRTVGRALSPGGMGRGAMVDLRYRKVEGHAQGQGWCVWRRRCARLLGDDGPRWRQGRDQLPLADRGRSDPGRQRVLPVRPDPARGARRVPDLQLCDLDDLRCRRRCRDPVDQARR